MKLCQTHLDIISDLKDAVKRHKLVEDDDQQLIMCLCNQGLDLKKKEIARLEDLIKSVQLIRQQVGSMSAYINVVNLYSVFR